METKTCHKCGEEKPLEAFDRRSDSKDGFRSQCRPCGVKYRKENAGRIAEQRVKHDADYRKKNAEKIAERKARYTKENAENIAERKARYTKKNAEKIAERKARYTKENAEKVAQQKRKTAAKSTLNITRAYVSRLLKVPVAEIPQEMLELKREQLLTHRLTKQLFAAIKEQQK